MQAAAKHMIKADKGGAIVNISSIESIVPAFGHAHYAASKAGAIMLGKSAALEFSQYNILVKAVSTSLINLPNLDKDWPEGVERFLNRVPLQRIGEVEDIADDAVPIGPESQGGHHQLEEVHRRRIADDHLARRGAQ